MNPLERFSDSFSLFGDIHLTACPLCGGTEIGELWRLPQTHLGKISYLDAPDTPYDRLYLAYLPTLQVPQTIFKFDICAQCESVFLNPCKDHHQAYQGADFKITRLKQDGLDGYRDAAEVIYKRFPPNTKRVIDAGCGAGQILCLLKEKDPTLNLAGLELSDAYVDFIQNDFGIEAHQVNLDLDDIDPITPP